MYNHVAGSDVTQAIVPSIKNEEYEAFLLIPDHVAVSFLSKPPRPSLHIGRFYFADIFHAEGGEFRWQL
jgi:hypothetical protein